MQVIYDKKNKEYLTRLWGFRKDDPDIILKDNFEFSAKLVYKGFTRGRSALNIIWRDEKGRKYYSSMTMLDEALKNTPDDQSVYLGGGRLSWGRCTQRIVC